MQVDWHTTVARYESSKDLYIGLSLLHPCYLEGVGCSEKEAKSLIERVQGQRAFVDLVQANHADPNFYGDGVPPELG